MLLDEKPYTFDRVVRIGIAVGLLAGLVWLLGYLSDVLIPFAIALLLAYLINPLVLRIQRRIHSRVAAVFISLSVIVGAAALFACFIVPLISDDLRNTGRVISQLVDNADLAQRAAKQLPPDIWQVIKDYAAQEEVQALFRTENFWKIVESAVRKLLPGLWGLIAGTASLVMGLVGLAIIGLYLVFLLIDFQEMRETWKDLIPPVYREMVIGFVYDFNSAMSRYFRGQALVASIVGVFFALGFWLIGLPMGILLGLFIGLLNMVPYLQLIGFIPAFFFATIQALQTGGSFWFYLSITGLVFAIVQLIQDTILVPRIMGRATGLSPVMILLSLSVWGKLLGFLGLIIALPLTFLIIAYYKRFLISSAGKGITLPPA